MKPFDVSILTAAKFLNPVKPDWYVKQVLEEDQLVKNALERKGLRVHRISWDNTEFDWKSTGCVLFRTIWDYFDRFDSFQPWLYRIQDKTKLINPFKTIVWNLDKHYLSDLEVNNINIPPTLFIESGDTRSLHEIAQQTAWKTFILKPAISGAGRHTYKFDLSAMHLFKDIYDDLIKKEAMLLQEYQHQITSKGEVAMILFDGNFSHAVLKKAKRGDFRVQDDFGGTVHNFTPSHELIRFSEKILTLIKPVPAYARVDIIWDNQNQLCVSELELIEPELWFRFNQQAAKRLAEAVSKRLMI